jgi:hypothetical protein
MNLKFLQKYPWGSFILVFCFAVVGNLAADRLARIFSRWGWNHITAFALLICLLSGVLFSAWIYKGAIRFLLPRSLSRQEVVGRKCLILFVSTQTEIESRKLIDASTNLSDPIWQGTTQGKWEKVILTGDLAKDVNVLNTLPRPWNWQQLLRAIKPHVATLKRVYLLGSKDEKGRGSHHELGSCKKLLQRYLHAEIILEEEWVDFEDFRAVVALLDKVIKTEKKKQTADKEIVIDVTGGQKTASIAGASVTLNSDAVFQYVQTAGDPPKVYEYDVIYRAPVSSQSS